MSTRAKKRVSCVPDHGKTCFRAKKCTFRTLTIFMNKITFSHLLISSDEKYCMILVRKHFFAFTLIILYYNTRFARIVNRIIRVKCKKVTFSVLDKIVSVDKIVSKKILRKFINFNFSLLLLHRIEILNKQYYLEIHFIS